MKKAGKGKMSKNVTVKRDKGIKNPKKKVEEEEERKKVMSKNSAGVRRIGKGESLEKVRAKQRGTKDKKEKKEMIEKEAKKIVTNELGGHSKKPKTDDMGTEKYLRKHILVSFRLNGKDTAIEVEPTRSLLSVLRYDLGLTGAKEGCGEGECGACTVLLDGKAVNSCLVMIGEVDGHEITTIEGLSAGPTGCMLNELQQAFVETGALQCGFCTPGMLVTLHAFLKENPSPTDEEIKEAIGGNLCRCTGYVQIIQAVRKVIDAVKTEGSDKKVSERSAGGDA